ncbi:hypothetical protein Hanom_Chr07g00594001 [Helianthus anomalus]
MMKGVMVKGFNMMVMMAYMILKMAWMMFKRSPLSWPIRWPLKVLEQVWVRFVFLFLKYEMETIDAKYVIPFEYYKVQTI